IWADLIRRYHANLDSNLLNLATVGLYPKIPEALAGMEGALVDVATGENLAVMHSRRWYWMQNALAATWPLISQPGVVAQTLGANYAEAYGRGIRGMLPNGTPVLVDNNVATNLGAGTNEDEIYTVDKNHCHLWEDPSAPLMIRAEQPKAGSLGVQLVVYGYYAFTFQRYPHARKIGGTGLITPAFTG
ncbi:hypothetical protein, partial [Saccharothrix lopnurensis]